MEKMNINQKQQSGFVSIVVCMIIMIILSLITVGFAQIMAREQREALDRQLSSQAFYAAESGVNDASVNITAYSSNNCTATNLSSDGSVRTTCVTASSETEDIVFDEVSTNQNQPKVFPIRTVGGLPTEISITWRPQKTTTGWSNFRNNTDQTWSSSNNWQINTGVLKIYLIPFSNGDGRTDLLNKSALFLLNPTASASPVPTVNYSATRFSGPSYGSIVNGSCADASGCRANVRLDLGFAYSDLYMVVTSVYQNNAVTIDAVNGAQNLKFTGVQAVIDSTGRTSDVLRRIQVRKSLIDSYIVPAGALQSYGSGDSTVSGGICKLFTANGASVSISDSTGSESCKF